MEREFTKVRWRHSKQRSHLICNIYLIAGKLPIARLPPGGPSSRRKKQPVEGGTISQSKSDMHDCIMPKDAEPHILSLC